MPYTPAKDPHTSNSIGPDRFGRKGAVVTPSDSSDFQAYCKLLVTATGTLQILPVENQDGEWLDLGTVQAGFIVPYEVRRVKVGSTAIVVTIG